MLIALTEDERDGSAYMDSLCVLLVALFDDCSSLILALLLCNKLNMITVAVTRTATLVISATTRELMVARYAVLVHASALFLSCDVVVVTVTG